MANHKRKKPRQQRAGCIMCKFHKTNAAKDTKSSQTLQDRRSRDSMAQQVAA